MLGLALLAACNSVSSTAADAPSQTTDLTAVFLATRTLDRAFFGVSADGKLLRVHAYGGAGITACPRSGDQPPDYLLGIQPIWLPPETGGTTSTFIDSLHDMLPGPEPYAEVAYLKKTIVSGPRSDTFAVFDVDLGFVSGTIVGHIYAVHCTTLDGF